MTDEQAQQVDLLQTNLSSIRKIAGWTLDELGGKIGVTKQTIFNLETKKTTMTLTQYIAIRAVIDYEIQNNQDNTLLGQVVEILLDRAKDLSNQERKQLQQQVSDISKMTASGVSKEIIKTACAALAIGGIPGIGAAIAVGVIGGWMSHIQKKE